MKALSLSSQKGELRERESETNKLDFSNTKCIPYFILCGIWKAGNVFGIFCCCKRNGFVQMNPIVNTIHLSL